MTPRSGLSHPAGPVRRRGPDYRLPRYVGLRRTKELLITGELLSGRQCADWGLANVSAPAGELDGAVAEFIAPMKDKSAFTMRITKLRQPRPRR